MDCRGDLDLSGGKIAAIISYPNVEAALEAAGLSE